MKLSLSVRVAEKFHAKREANMTLEQLAALATDHGYSGLCMRASQVGVHSPPETVAAARALLDRYSLAVSMLTGDFPIPENSDQGPDALRNITPYLDLAEQLDVPLALHRVAQVPALGLAGRGQVLGALARRGRRVLGQRRGRGESER